MPPTFPAARPGTPGRRLVVTLLATFAAGALAQQSFEVAMRDGLLSIRANGTSASELAAALAEETGIRVVVTGDAEQGMTTEIVKEPLVKAIALLSPNHLLVRGEGGTDAPVVEIVLMLDEAGSGAASGEEMEFLPSGAPADELVSGEESPELYGDEETFADDDLSLDEQPVLADEFPSEEEELPPDDDSLVQ